MDRTTLRHARRLLTSAALIAAMAGTSPAQRAPAGNDARAKAQTQAQAVARPLMVNVLDFGAKGDGQADDTAAIQLAIDTLAARMAKIVQPGFTTAGTVLIPSTVHSYKTSAPIWVDHPCIEIRGEGPSSRIETAPERAHPIFVFGLRRVANIVVDGKPVEISANRSYRPDLFGRLDESAAPARGKRWGFRSRGDALIQAQAGPLSDGAQHSRKDATLDHWTEVPALTMEFAVEGPDAHLPSSLPLYGLGSASNFRPLPFMVSTGDPGQIWVQFATQSAPFGPINTRNYSFHYPPAKGKVRRFTIQIDLQAAKFAVYVDGVQVKVDQTMGEKMRPGDHLAENDFMPLLIGNGGGSRPSFGTASGIDWILYGFLFSRTARYLDDGPGRPQRRADKPDKPIDDQYRYFTPPADDPGHIAHLAFTDDPAGSPRALTIQGGPAVKNLKAVAFIHNALGGNQGGILNNSIRDLQLVGGNLFGQNIAIAQILDMRISGVRSIHAYHAIGSLSHGANYVVKLEDCVLQGYDSGYFGLDQVLWARNVEFVTAGRATMRFVGSIVRMQNAMVFFHSTGNQSTIKLHAGDYGGNYSFENVCVDYEGSVYEQAAIYCESHPYCAATSLRLNDILLGTVGEKIPIIMLKHFPPSVKAYISGDNIQAINNKAGAVVDVEGTAWYGELRGVTVGEALRVITKGKENTTSKVIVRD
jgi:hypothetical protein